MMRSTSRPAIFAGVLGRLALRVVEVGGDGDDGLGDRVAEVVLGGLLHLLKDHRRDLGRRVALALDLDRGDVAWPGDDLVRNALDLVLDLVHPAAHEALDREDGVLRVRYRLTLGDLADEPLAVLREADDRRRRATAFGVRDDDRVSAFHDRDHGVRRSEIDSNDFVGHCFLFEYLSLGRGIANLPGTRPTKAIAGPGIYAKLAGNLVIRDDETCHGSPDTALTVA